MPTGPRPIEPSEGDEWLACIDERLDPGAATAWVVRPGCGAVVCFTGTARDHAGDRTGVHLLEYEAYTEQVVPALRATAAGLRDRFPDVGRVALWHRTGALEVTDVAVVVAVSTPHRDAAFEAARWAIDDVKATAPIWKREHHDGGVEWGRCDHRAGHDGIGELGDPAGTVADDPPVIEGAVVLNVLLYLLVPVVIVAVAASVTWMRNRQPTSLESGVDSFRREMDALSPEAAPSPRRRAERSEPDRPSGPRRPRPTDRRP